MDGPAVNGAAAHPDTPGEGLDGGASGLRGEGFEGVAHAGGSAHAAASSALAPARDSSRSTAPCAAAAVLNSVFGSASNAVSQWARYAAWSGRGRGDAQAGAYDRRSEFGYEFLSCVLGAVEGLAEFGAVEAAGVAGPVHLLVEHGGVERRGVVVLVDAWDIDPVWARCVVGAISAVVNVRADGGDPLICRSVGDGDGLGVVAVDLVGVEHGIDTRQQPFGLMLHTLDGGGRVGVVGLEGDPFGYLGGSFAFAHLGAVLGPLLVGCPFPVG